MTEPLVAARRLGVVFFPAFDWAISATHPEREERLLYTRDQLQEEGLFDIPGITEYRRPDTTPCAWSTAIAASATSTTKP